MATDLTMNQVLSELEVAMVEKERRNRKFHIVFLGASGAGKTSWLNLVEQLRVMNECGFDRMITDFKLCNDEKLERDPKDTMASKTSSTKSYDIKIGDITIMITDTPGLGVDTAGIGKEKENVRNIVEHLKKIEYVDCICLVINGRSPRAFPEVKYALSEISTILPNVARNNLIICLTNSQSALQVSFELSILEDFFKHTIEKDKTFYVDNPLCSLEKAIKLQLMKDVEVVKETKRDFEKACKEFNRILLRIKAFDSLSTTSFMEVYKAKQAVEREILAVTVHQYNQVQLLVKKQSIANAGKVKFSRVSLTGDIHYNTLCDHPGCYSNCHLNCHLPHSFDTEVFKECACMVGSSQPNVCAKCKHSYVTHYHQYVRFDRQEECEEYEIIAAQIKKDSTQALENLSARILEFNSLSNTKNFIQVLSTQMEVVKEYQRIKDTEALKAAAARLDSALKIVKLDH